MTDVPVIYDMTLDQPRPATQKDVDDLTALVQKLGRVRNDLLAALAHFPTVSEDLALGQSERRRLHAKFLQGSGRFPVGNEHLAASDDVEW